MPEELQAFVGHVLVVGGRAVRVPPPGALAELAPRRAARGREGDSFVILVTPQGSQHANAATYERLARLAADTYFSSGGGVTGGLREAFTMLNHHLRHDPATSGLRVNAVALVLHGSDLYAARSGGAFAVLRRAAGLVFFPEERHDPLSVNLAPLGANDTPEIQLTRFEVTAGQVMMLCDESLQHAPTTTLELIVGSDGVGDIVSRLRTLSSHQMAVSVIEFVRPSTPDPGHFAVPVPDRERVVPASMPEPASSTRVDWEKDLLHEPVPVPDDVAAASAAPVADAFVEVTPPDAGAGAEPAPPSPAEPYAAPEAPPATVSPFSDATAAPPAGQIQPTAPFVASDEIPDAPGARDSAPAVRTALAQRVRGAFAAIAAILQPTPDEDDFLQEEATPRTPGILNKAQAAIARRGRQALRAILVGLVAVFDFLVIVLNRLVPEPEDDKRSSIPTNVAIGLAVMIPVVIVMAAVGMALLGAEKSEFETYLDRAQNAHAEAMKLSDGSCDNQALRPLWVEVLRLSEQAQELRPNDTTALTINADAKNYLDCYDGVVRRDLTLLHTYPRDTDMVTLIVHGGVDLYALDRRNSVVYHNTLNASGNGLTDTGNTPVIWKGQTISGATGNFIVADIIDIVWLADGGTRPKNVLVALDRNGVLVAYSQTYFTSAQELVIEGRWQEPIALAAFRSNLYVLDRDAHQIWRYVPPAGAESYSNAPEEYFNGDELPDLTGAVDFGISDDGAVYILFEDGTVRRYRRNIQGIVEEQPFDFRQRPPGAITSGAAIFVDNDPASRSLYIVDVDNQAIYETSWAGTFNQGYRPRNMPDAFQDVQGFYADSVVRNNMYVLAENKLYHFYRFR